MEEKEVEVKYKDRIKCSFTFSKEIFEEFRGSCNELGIKMSPRIEILLKRDISLLKSLDKVE